MDDVILWSDNELKRLEIENKTREESYLPFLDQAPSFENFQLISSFFDQLQNLSPKS